MLVAQWFSGESGSMGSNRCKASQRHSRNPVGDSWSSCVSLLTLDRLVHFLALSEAIGSHPRSAGGHRRLSRKG